MNLPGLFFLFALYTLVVAAVVVGTIYVANRKRRSKLHGLPIPNIAGLNVRPAGERTIAAWPAPDPAARTRRPATNAPSAAAPLASSSVERFPGEERPLTMRGSRRPLGPVPPLRAVAAPLVPVPRRAEVGGEIDGAATAVLAVLPDVAASPFAAAFLPGGALLPEGLRTLEVTPNRIVEPGMTVRATVTFRNPGGGAASGFRAHFGVPDGLIYAPGSARIDDAPLAEPDGTVPLLEPQGADIGEIPAGGERRVSLAFTVAATIENGTPVALQAAIASPEVPAIGSNVVRLVVHSRPVLTGPQTTLTLVAARGALPGEELTLTARVHNSGQSSAHDLIVLLPVPANTRFCAGSVSVDGRPFDEDGTATQFGFGRPTVVAPFLEPGASVEIAYRMRIDSPLEDATPVVAQGTVCSQEVAEFALPPIRLEIGSAASFDDDATSLRIDCADEVEPGERLRVVLRATNGGTATARDVTLAIELPAGMIATAGSLTIDGAPVPDRGSFPGPIGFGDLGPGRTVELALSAIVQSPIADGSVLRPAAQVTWSKGERRFERALVVRSAPRFPADFNTIERASAARVRPGDAVSYTIGLANMGTDIATNVCLALTADAELEDLRVRDGDVEIPLDDDSTIRLGTLVPGISRVLRVAGRVAHIIEDQRELRLRAALHGEDIGRVDLGAVAHIVESRPTFTLTTSGLRTDAVQTLRFNHVSACRLQLVNEGTDCGRDVRVALLLPDELQLDSVDDAARDGAAIVFGDIPAGEQREALLRLRLVGVVGDGEPLAVGARVAGRNVVPFNLTPITIATHAEAAFADGAALTSMPAHTADAGTQIAYTLTLRNSGDGSAKQLTARIAALTNAVYAQGTTTVNGIALQDHAGTSLLLNDRGLQLADVGPGVEIVASWEVIVNMPLPPGTTIESAAAVRWDSAAEFTVNAAPVPVRSTSALPIVDPVLPFSVLGAIARKV
jgi:uncharacterized repeat protein (TIGR01451 family)